MSRPVRKPPPFKKTPPCLVCGARLESVFWGANQPNDGLEFTSKGHYGSTVFDPGDGSYLAVNICDPCLLVARKKRRVLYCDPGKVLRPKPIVAIWGKSK